MRKGFALSVCVLVVTGAAVAGDVDKARVRQLIQLPRVTALGGIGFDGAGRFTAPGDLDEAPNEIAALQQALSKDADNAEHWARLAELYGQTHKKELGEEAQKKALALFRQRAAASPEDGFTLARLGDALPATEHEEAEKLLRR